MWMERGIKIKYQKFQLPHDVELMEPKVEIEMDEYRSYHRDKRSPKKLAL
jgi:tRNA (guanine-N7-)-methyltransferase